MLGVGIGGIFNLLLYVAVLSFCLDSLATETSLGQHYPMNEIFSQLATFPFFSVLAQFNLFHSHVITRSGSLRLRLAQCHLTHLEMLWVAE